MCRRRNGGGWRRARTRKGTLLGGLRPQSIGRLLWPTCTHRPTPEDAAQSGRLVDRDAATSRSRGIGTDNRLGWRGWRRKRPRLPQRRGQGRFPFNRHETGPQAQATDRAAATEANPTIEQGTGFEVASVHVYREIHGPGPYGRMSRCNAVNVAHHFHSVGNIAADSQNRPSTRGKLLNHPGRWEMPLPRQRAISRHITDQLHVRQRDSATRIDLDRRPRSPIAGLAVRNGMRVAFCRGDLTIPKVKKGICAHGESRRTPANQRCATDRQRNTPLDAQRPMNFSHAFKGNDARRRTLEQGLQYIDRHGAEAALVAVTDGFRGNESEPGPNLHRPRI